MEVSNSKIIIWLASFLVEHTPHDAAIVGRPGFDPGKGQCVCTLGALSEDRGNLVDLA